MSDDASGSATAERGLEGATDAVANFEADDAVMEAVLGG